MGSVQVNNGQLNKGECLTQDSFSLYVIIICEHKWSCLLYTSYDVIEVEAEKDNLDDAMYGEDMHVDTDSVCDPYYKYHHQKLVTRKPKGKFARLCKCLSHPFQKLINKFTNASRNRHFT